MSLIWRNGQWIDFSGFRITPTDRGLMHGLGLFETILAVGGRPVFLERHLARLADGCRRFAWSISFDDAKEAMPRLLAANDGACGRFRIRLSVTAGSGELADLSSGNDRLVVMTASRVSDPPAAMTANLSRFCRNEHSPLAGLKCASYAENSVALDAARQLGFAETVFPNTAGNLCEAATANLFIVRGGELFTPSLASGCLPGVTRGVVIGLANLLGIPCHEADLPVSSIHQAEEIFLTSSTRGVVGLSRFETRELPIGPLTTRLRMAWNDEVSRESKG